jgi:hypothetical protein
LYLLPFALIDARTARLKVYDMVQLKQLGIVTHTTNGAYTRTSFNMEFKDGKRHSFDVTDKKIATGVPARWDKLKEQTAAAHGSNNMAALQGLDPFFELRSSGWKLKPSAEVAKPLWARVLGSRMVVAILAGSLAAVLLVFGRNLMSDRAMYRYITQHPTEANYQGYINNGWLKVREARAALPRVAFEEVRKQKSVTELKNVLKRYPRAGLQNDVQVEIHALYQSALAKFQAQLGEGSTGGLLPVMQRLLDYLETSGSPDVEIHFSRPTTTALEQLDQRLKERGGKLGNVIPAASYFSANSAGTREARIANGLQVGFRAIFPNDVLALRVNNAPSAKPPMLDIVYNIEPSGSLYTEQNKDLSVAARQFVGLVAHFKVALVVPQAAQQWQFQLEVQPPDTFTVNHQIKSGEKDNGPSDGQVYAVMAERAFDQLASKLRSEFFHSSGEVAAKPGKP